MGPFVPISFDISMQVWARHFRIVRIPVGRAVKVEPHEDDRLPRPILESGFCELDLRPRDVEHKVLPLVLGRQGNCQSLTGRWKSMLFVIYPSLFHRNEAISL